MDNIEKYFLKLCDKHLEAYCRGVRDLELSEMIRKIIPQIEDFDKKYRRLFYIRMCDFFALTILVRIDDSLRSPDTCGESEMPFMLVKDEQQWVSVIKHFYSRIKLHSEVAIVDPGREEELTIQTKQLKANMEVSSSLWEKYKKEQGLSTTPH